MKIQNNNKLGKKIAFIYKSNKNQNGYQTDPSTVTAQSIIISYVFNK